HPSWRAILSFYIKGLLGAVVIGAIGWLVGSVGLGIVIAVVLFAVAVVVGFVKRIATTYSITNQRLRIRRGIISRNVQETRVDRIQNVNTEQGVLDRILLIGTVDYDTEGTDDADFSFVGVGQPEQVALVDARARPARHDTVADAEHLLHLPVPVECVLVDRDGLLDAVPARRRRGLVVVVDVVGGHDLVDDVELALVADLVVIAAG